jgi:hypothetical protein
MFEGWVDSIDLTSIQELIPYNKGLNRFKISIETCYPSISELRLEDIGNITLTFEHFTLQFTGYNGRVKRIIQNNTPTDYIASLFDLKLQKIKEALDEFEDALDNKKRELTAGITEVQTPGFQSCPRTQTVKLRLT